MRMQLNSKSGRVFTTGWRHRRRPLTPSIPGHRFWSFLAWVSSLEDVTKPPENRSAAYFGQELPFYVMRRAAASGYLALTASRRESSLVFEQLGNRFDLNDFAADIHPQLQDISAISKGIVARNGLSGRAYLVEQPKAGGVVVVAPMPDRSQDSALSAVGKLAN